MQGVSYRASTAEEARRLGVVGWVRNRREGSVELEVEGEDGAVDELLAWCAHGPPSARVAGVATEDLAVLGTERTFAIVG